MLSHIKYIIRKGFAPLLLALLLLPSWLGGGAFAASVRQVLVDTPGLGDPVSPDSLAVRDSIIDPADSLRAAMDSLLDATDLSEAIARDSMSSDSVKKKKEGGGLTAVVNYKAKDSVVFTMGNLAWLYGQSQITYADIQLDAERIQLSLDSSLVHANGVPDSLGKLQGKPIFKDNSGEYETRTMSYNFKTAKGYICDVVTQQGDGYVTGGVTKKMPDSDIFLEDGKYTTCDQVECPHFYIQLTKARVRPKKNIVTGPAYLVVADVPLPVAIPFGYFPFTKSYSSGIIMPSYGTDQQRGLYLRDGGYYFAINDYVDLALKGELYTKGSWGVSAESRYSVRYMYKGNFSFSYLVSKTGDKGLQDYQEQNNMRVVWSHSQDSRFNPNLTLSASVNYTTSGFERSNTRSLYSNEMTQSTKSSTINATYKVPNSLWSLSASTSITQRTTDSTLVVSLPDLSLSMSRWFPFKRKVAAGADRWYEKISMTYQGRISNNITSKQDEIMHKSLIRDWDNGMQHSIPISATFTALKYINITPSFSFTDRTYTHKTIQYYDPGLRDDRDGAMGGVAKDTVYGFYNAYNFNTAISANTKLYGFYTPLWKNSKLVAVRHLLTPSISFNYTPDFSDKKYGSWGTYYVPDSTSATGRKEVKYSYFQGYKFGTTSQGRSGSISLSLANNIEAKFRSDKDSTGYKKVSIIDNLTTNISYNMVADSMRWSTTLPVTATFKFSKNSTMNLSATYDMYCYDQNGKYYDKFRIFNGKMPRLMNTGYSWSYQLNNQKLAKLFGRGSDSDDDDDDDDYDEDLDFDEDGYEDDEIDPTTIEGMQRNQAKNKRKKEKKAATGKYDDDGYLIWKLPWSLNFSYSMRYQYDNKKFDKETCEYGRSIVHSATLSGTFQPTEAWNFSFNASYDFNLGKVTHMNINCTRDMHCWALTASLNPMGQYASFNVNIAVKSSMLSDLKYEKTSVSRSNKIDWYND